VCSRTIRLVALHGPCHQDLWEAPSLAGRRALSISSSLSAVAARPRWTDCIWGRAFRRRHMASVRTFPGLIGMVLANPAAVIAAKAFHWFPSPP